MTIEFVATINGLVGALMPLPQIVRVLRSKQTNDVSIGTWIISLITSIIWGSYGSHLHAIPLICASILMITLDVVLISSVLWIRYKPLK